MPVDEQVQEVLEEYARLGARPLATLSAQEARLRPTIADAVNALRLRRGETVTLETVAEARDETIRGPDGEIRARIYRPAAGGPLPLLMYFHDGGWTLGDLESCDATCRALTNLVGCVVISVAYRLAPEHRFPAAAQDAYAAMQWAAAAAPALGVDPTRVAVGGEGSGGNLAAAVALMARDSEAHLPIYQALVCPMLNYGFHTASYEQQAYVRPLTREEMRWFWKQYLPDSAAGTNPYASPLRAEAFGGVPPALILTAEYDVLRDEGEAYGRRLEAAGVPTVVRRCAGLTHGFLSMTPVVEQARDALLEMARWLRSAFGFGLEPGGSKTLILVVTEPTTVVAAAGLHMASLSERLASPARAEVAEAMEGEALRGASLGEDAARAEHLARGEHVPLVASQAAAARVSVGAADAGRESAAVVRPGAAETAGGMAGAPLETGVLAPRVGMEVVDADGRRVGKVKAVRARDFVIDRRFRRDVALPFEAIQEAGDRVVLSLSAREVMRTDWSPPGL